MKTDKLTTLEDVVKLIPETDCVLSFGGVTLYRRPMAFALALLSHFHAEATPKNLTLLCFTAGLESDILVGAGMVAKVQTCYFGLEAFGLAPNFTSAANKGEIEIIEETEASLSFGLRATLADVGFMPSKAWQGTDLLRLRPDVKTIEDPYTGERLTALPAVKCDVAILHALEADRDGNASIGTHWGVDRELALVADQVILTAEKIVPRLKSADIFSGTVHAVVEVPGGAWPTSCHPNYPFDGHAILDYTDKAGGDSYDSLLASWRDRHFPPPKNES
jgi:glutaconate CoA-transferase subunit A